MPSLGTWVRAKYCPLGAKRKGLGPLLIWECAFSLQRAGGQEPPLEGKVRCVVAPYGGKQLPPESPLVPTIFGPDPYVGFL